MPANHDARPWDADSLGTWVLATRCELDRPQDMDSACNAYKRCLLSTLQNAFRSRCLASPHCPIASEFGCRTAQRLGGTQTRYRHRCAIHKRIQKRLSQQNPSANKNLCLLRIAHDMVRPRLHQTWLHPTPHVHGTRHNRKRNCLRRLIISG